MTDEMEVPQDISVRNGLSMTVVEQIDDGNTVGIATNVEPGETTITHEVGEHLFSDFHPSIGWSHRDEPAERMFLLCDGGDVTAQPFPEFAPIETNVGYEQYQTAIDELGTDHGFDVHFDDGALVVFETDELAVVTAPMTYGWETPRPTRPRYCIEQPSIRDGDGDA